MSSSSRMSAAIKPSLIVVPLFLLLCGVDAANAQTSVAETSRPNILFVFADDWGRQASSYASVDSISRAVQTPHFDRIAREGVLFKNAFVNAPSCTPCRSSLVSGQYFWRTGRAAILQGAVWDMTIPAWPLLLRDAGYHLGKSYKVWGPGVPADAPIGGKQYAFEKAGRQINQFSQHATRLVAKGQTVVQAKQELLEQVRANFATFLSQRDPSQPFCFWYGPTNVHRKWVRGSGKSLWGIDPDALQGMLPPFLPDVPTVREDIADYLGEVQAFDASLGVLLQELAQSGMYDNTIIVISGDHGPAGFPHGKCNLYDFGTRVSLAVAGPKVPGGRVVDDWVSLPDLAPTFLEAAGVEIPSVMTAQSLWPVLQATTQGQVDPDRKQVFMGRERHVEMARPGYRPYPQRAIRTPDHALVINFKPDRFPLGDPYRLDSDNPPTTQQVQEKTFVTLADEDAGPTKAWLVDHRNDSQWKPIYENAYGKRPREELFDMRTDPHQMHNVAGDPAYADVLSELRDRLMDELRRSGDPRVVNDGEFFETPPMAGPLPDDVPHPNRKLK
ncbi:Choline-sulfatase [Novipirellula galeiformis]|uniref:Choline-sulfatase n=1 Tax=Novipirellula galeiformis TaxID=2528004 RepID=A0A5C6C8H4_9BACT|nr:sulfatase [Novipirellula galeiformis]TWU20478.1 Choline-sulfatase [Novipirellula galeiformis]